MMMMMTMMMTMMTTMMMMMMMVMMPLKGAQAMVAPKEATATIIQGDPRENGNSPKISLIKS